MSKFKFAPDYECQEVRTRAADPDAKHYGHERGYVVLQKRQRCRECGQYISVGEEAIQFEFNPSEWSHWGRPAFLHKQQCFMGAST